MRKGASESDGSGPQHQPHYGGLDVHQQHHQQHQQLVMHNLQSSQVLCFGLWFVHANKQLNSST